MGNAKRTGKQQGDQALKKDEGKPPISLIPYEFIEGVSEILAFGVGKYSRYGWAQGIEWHRILDGIYRHVGKWEKGINFDEDTGQSHLLHAACGLMFLYMSQLYRLGEDTRWQRPKK